MQPSAPAPAFAALPPAILVVPGYSSDTPSTAASSGLAAPPFPSRPEDVAATAFGPRIAAMQPLPADFLAGLSHLPQSSCATA